MSFDHNGWIDQQRQAGAARGNVFADILAEAARRRTRPTADRAPRAERIKSQAREWDAQVDRESNRGRSSD